MAHAQKPDFVFRRNGQVHLNRRRASVQSTTSSRVVCISCINVGSEAVRRVLATHSLHQILLQFPSRASPCAITFQLESTSKAPFSFIRRTEINLVSFSVTEKQMNDSELIQFSTWGTKFFIYFICAASDIVTLCRWLFCALVEKEGSFLTGAQDSHLQTVTIPDIV
jgi:hypothetical protein